MAKKNTWEKKRINVQLSDNKFRDRIHHCKVSMSSINLKVRNSTIKNIGFQAEISNVSGRKLKDPQNHCQA